MAGVSYLQAALTVLADLKRPLTSRELIEEALRRKLIQPMGKTPGATLTARLYLYMRDHPDGTLLRLADAGPRRARRGSVRWTLRDDGR